MRLTFDFRVGNFTSVTLLFVILYSSLPSLCQAQVKTGRKLLPRAVTFRENQKPQENNKTPEAAVLRIQQRILNTVLDEFVGPFPSWADAKRDFGAKGDGQADDTAALQAAIDAINKDNAPAVLYLPAGTYRITRTLNMVSHFGRSVIGEDPKRTIIRWDGEKGGTMLFRNGTRWGTMARLTWDGQSKAQTAIRQIWDGMVPNYATYNQHVDEIFKDCDFGLRIGKPHNGDAECAILRCQFIRCKRAGLSINSFNSLDIWAWNCLFDSCGIGATNQSFTEPSFYADKSPNKGVDLEGGAGHFHAYQCLFRGSKVADMTTMHTSDYFGIRQNVSLGSKAFFLALGHPTWGNEYSFTVPIHLQENLVLDTQDATPIRFAIPGNAVLIDNIIRTQNEANSAPVVEMAAPTEGSLIAIGNTFATDNAIRVKGKSFTLDNRTAILNAIRTLPNITKWEPPVEVSQKRRVFEIAPGSDATAIQSAIDAAAKLKGSRPIIHLPNAVLNIDRTLVVPAGSDVQIVGDGGNTQLRWNGTEEGPVLLLKGPTRATLREFQIMGAPKPGAAVASGIIIEKADQSNGRIFGEQLLVNGNTGILVEGLDKTSVMLFDGGPGSEGKGVALKVVGGVEAAKGKPTLGAVYLWGGATSNNHRTYDLRNNGTLLIRDTWYEGSASDQFIEFTREHSGTFVLDGGKIAVQPIKDGRVQPLHNPSVTVDGFRGKAVFIGISMSADNRFKVRGDEQTNVLLMGILGGTKTPILATDGTAKAVVMVSRDFIAQPNMRTVGATDLGKIEAEWLREMLRPVRQDWHRSLSALPEGTTDARLFRVVVSYAKVGIHIKN